MTRDPHLSAEAFDQLFQELCNWGRWGPDDERGTLNYIAPEHVRAATALVRTGRSVSMAIPVNTVAGPDNARPALHAMLQAHDVPSGPAEPRFAMDWLACACHGDCHTHIDALCQIAYRGQLYNGAPASSVNSRAGLPPGSLIVPRMKSVSPSRMMVRSGLAEISKSCIGLSVPYNMMSSATPRDLRAPPASPKSVMSRSRPSVSRTIRCRLGRLASSLAMADWICVGVFAPASSPT